MFPMLDSDELLWFHFADVFMLGFRSRVLPVNAFGSYDKMFNLAD